MAYLCTQTRKPHTCGADAPKPAGPCSSGAAQLRDHANPKWHTFVRRPGSRTAAGPTHPKPAGPCSCGAAELRGHANPKSHTFVRSRGCHTAAGPTYPKPAGPHSCGATQTLNDIPLYAVPEAAQLRGRCTLNQGAEGRTRFWLKCPPVPGPIRSPITSTTPPLPPRPRRFWCVGPASVRLPGLHTRVCHLGFAWPSSCAAPPV